MWVFTKWATSFFFFTWAFGAVFCEAVEVDNQNLTIKVATVGSDEMALLAMREYANTTDPSDVDGYEGEQASATRSAQNSKRCGIQNSDEPYKKIYARSEDGGRIIGGSDAGHGEFPWQISLQGKPSGTEYLHKCGGAIVRENVVVTAGHCVYGENVENLRVVAGADNIFNPTGYEQIRQVKSYISNFHMDWENPVDDIAVIILDQPLNFDSVVSPVCLPKTDFVYDGIYGVVTGWGDVTERGGRARGLQVVNIPIIPLEKCREIYRKVNRQDVVKQCKICAGSNIGGRDSCQGDSGGPMTCVEDDGRHYLCGIVSWGIGCGRPDSPGVYTFTPCYSDWIYRLIATHT